MGAGVTLLDRTLCWVQGPPWRRIDPVEDDRALIGVVVYVLDALTPAGLAMLAEKLTGEKR